jgi:hypothetical protein
VAEDADAVAFVDAAVRACAGYTLEELRGMSLTFKSQIEVLRSRVTAEREACAEVCDWWALALDHGGNEYVRSRECKQAASAIRARKEDAK